MEHDINSIRKEIDEIDSELVALFLQRMSCSARVAEYKREHGLPVLDAAREKELLDKISELSGKEFEEYTKVLYKTILSISRDYQTKKLGGDNKL